MAPKAAAKGAPKADGAKGKPKVEEEAAAASAPVSAGAAPTNKDEVLSQINLEGLPHCPNEQILEIMRDKYENLAAVFINYCKNSECKNMEQATRLRLGARPDAAALCVGLGLPRVMP